MQKDDFQDFSFEVNKFLESTKDIDGSANPSQLISTIHKLDSYEHELRRILVKMDKVDRIKEQQILNLSQLVRESKTNLVTPKKLGFYLSNN